MNLNQYKTIIFDCDGVILNSNEIKTQAFYDVARVYGHKSAQRLKEYHIKNGGISRYEKFEYLFTNILQRPIDAQEFKKLLSNFSKEVNKALLICEIAENIKKLRDKTKKSKWLVVSGGDQIELREIFKKREITDYFDGGIFGSPDAKNEIIESKLESGLITVPALFIGDSRYDFFVSTNAELDFIFINGWTEVSDWKQFVFENKIVTVRQIDDLI